MAQQVTDAIDAARAEAEGGSEALGPGRWQHEASSRRRGFRGRLALSTVSATGKALWPGAAIEIGLLPITAWAPSMAGMSGAVFAAMIATVPASAIRSLNAPRGQNDQRFASPA